MSKGLFAGRYQLERVLGVGATATVHLARDTEGGTSVAIKILRQELAQSTATGRFLKEIRRTAQLDHPHILKVLDSGEFDGKPFFVLPYMEGGTLRAKLQQSSQLTFDETIAILRPIAQALDYAHTRGLIHRDVKPENILFTSGEACLGDFGIARAIETTFGTDGTTSSDTIRGTYAYMSPEQAAGAKTLDGRSDIYSLACVAYEMITGMQAFIGPTPEVVVAQRFNFAPREVRAFRPSAPPSLDAALAKAFAMSPADRYQRTTAFVDALEEAVTNPSSERSRNTEGTLARYFRSRVAQGAGIVALAGAGIGAWMTFKAPDLDAALYVVAPFSVTGTQVNTEIDGSFTATLAYDALRRWPDLHRVDPLRVNDFLSREALSIRSLEDALQLARSMNAGKLLWGEIHEQNGRTVVRAVLYDVVDPRASPREANVTVTVSDDSLGFRFAAMVDSLIGSGQPRPPIGNPHPYAAVNAYGAGIRALNNWDLSAAQQSFRAARTAAPNYPVANLRYAQVSQWLRNRPGDWRAAAVVAGASADLSPRERLLAQGLVALADRDYPLACSRFRQLAAQDSMSFAAWFGLGDCQRDDGLVVSDSSSPSRWRFRSSRHGASRAYLRAFDLVPTSYRAYSGMLGFRLETAFMARPGLSREGLSSEPNRQVFFARPELVAETTAFVPYPAVEINRARSQRPELVNAALTRAREEVARLADRWVQAAPDNADAWRIRALALERAGVIAGHPDRSAIGSIIHARRVNTNHDVGWRFAIDEVRMRLKAGEFRAARAVADEVVSQWRTATPQMSIPIARLAGLLGQLTVMEQLLERSASLDSSFVSMAGQQVLPDPVLAALSLRLQANAVLNGPRDTVAALERRIESHLAAVPRAEREAMRDALLRNAAMFAFPALGSRPLHASSGHGYLVDMQARLARGDTSVHRDLVALVKQREAAGIAPGVVSVDATFLEAAMLVQLGDSTLAVRRLDDVLENLPAQRDWFLDLHGAATLVSAMQLRASLAEELRDTKTAQRWRSAIRELRPQ